MIEDFFYIDKRIGILLFCLFFLIIYLIFRYFVFIYLYVFRDIELDGIVFWYIGINLFGLDVYLKDIMFKFFL